MAAVGDAHRSDLALARRVVRGDPKAADTLVDRHLNALHGFVYHRIVCSGGSRGDVEDVCQETILSAIESMAGYRGDSSLFVWLCGIAANKARDFRRREGRRSRIEIALEAAEPGLMEILERMDRDPLPEEVLEREEVRQAVGLAMSSLPPRYQEALRMKYMEDQSVREIGRFLRISEKAIESLLSRARVAFKEAFAALAEGAE